jgi:hypothetical protein
MRVRILVAMGILLVATGLVVTQSASGILELS